MKEEKEQKTPLVQKTVEDYLKKCVQSFLEEALVFEVNFKAIILPQMTAYLNQGKSFTFDKENHENLKHSVLLSVPEFMHKDVGERVDNIRNSSISINHKIQEVFDGVSILLHPSKNLMIDAIINDKQFKEFITGYARGIAQPSDLLGNVQFTSNLVGNKLNLKIKNCVNRNQAEGDKECGGDIIRGFKGVFDEFEIYAKSKEIAVNTAFEGAKFVIVNHPYSTMSDKQRKEVAAKVLQQSQENSSLGELTLYLLGIELANLDLFFDYKKYKGMIQLTGSHECLEENYIKIKESYDELKNNEKIITKEVKPERPLIITNNQGNSGCLKNQNIIVDTNKDAETGHLEIKSNYTEIENNNESKEQVEKKLTNIIYNEHYVSPVRHEKIKDLLVYPARGKSLAFFTPEESIIITNNQTIGAKITSNEIEESKIIEKKEEKIDENVQSNKSSFRRMLERTVSINKENKEDKEKNNTQKGIKNNKQPLNLKIESFEYLVKRPDYKIGDSKSARLPDNNLASEEEGQKRAHTDRPKDSEKHHSKKTKEKQTQQKTIG